MRNSILAILVTVFCTLRLMAQGTFVYTNNDPTGPNSISAFSVGADGALSSVPGSPFATGGSGRGVATFFASNRNAVVGNFLYAANTGSNDVSAFSINPATGVLTSVPGSPFETGGDARSGMSLTATPDEKFLIATNGTSRTITVFSLAANGALSQVAGSPFNSGASADLISAKATSDGKFLAVSSGKAIFMFTISAGGVLAPVPGSPTAAPTPDSDEAGIDCNCAGTQLYVGLANASNTQVDVFDIGPGGALSRTSGSPFTGPGRNSNVAVLSPDESKLFVSNQLSNTITVFSVAADGSLTVVQGSPFPVAGFDPAGIATNLGGNLLYTANNSSSISGFTIEANGALTPISGSPFRTGVPGSNLLSLAVFPAKNCCPAPVISNASVTPDVLTVPNHKFVNVEVDYTVAAPCPNTCVLTVASNEPVNGDEPDWQVTDAHHALLRAERASNGIGRIYTVTITCTNHTNKESSTRTLTVSVPHDKSH